MALDATVAGAAADSYLTVAQADALATADVGPEAEGWTAATLDQKERALKRATRDLDNHLRSGWPTYSATQALLFPRLIDRNATGPVLPRGVRTACYEQATYVLANAKVLDRANTRRARDMQSAAEPNNSYSQPVQSDVALLSPAALAYLAGYATAAGRRGMRSVRMSSGYLP